MNNRYKNTYFLIRKRNVDYEPYPLPLENYCRCPGIEAAESVSFRNNCMWIFLFDKKLHMTKLSITVKLIP